MNHYAIKQNAFSAYEEMIGSNSDKKYALLCPKPRRIGILNPAINDSTRALRCHVCTPQPELCDLKAGTEIVDIILGKDACGAEECCTQADSLPPFFSGSPPCRVSNPLIQDERFWDKEITPLPPHSIHMPSGRSLSPLSSKKGGFAGANFGNKPAVRIEGFDCLDRDRRNCSIPTLA